MLYSVIKREIKFKLNIEKCNHSNIANTVSSGVFVMDINYVLHFQSSWDSTGSLSCPVTLFMNNVGQPLHPHFSRSFIDA